MGSIILEVLLVVVCSFCAGWLGGSLRALALHRLTLGLQLRLKDCEERLLREDKRFAGRERWASKQKQDEFLERALEAAQAKKNEHQEAPWDVFK